MTTAQRGRIEHSSRLVDDWLAAVLSGVHHRQAATIAPIQAFLRLAPTVHDSHVRLVGLTTMTARRCAQLLPRPRGATPDGHWAISGDSPPHKLFAARLVTAYANGEDNLATDLVIAYLRQLECDDIQHELCRVLMYLANVYLWIDTTIRQNERTPVLRNVVHRLASAWRAGHTGGA